MRLLFASAEVAPFSKTGGLADVAGALPAALGRYLQAITVISPFYHDIDKERFAFRDTELQGEVTLGTGSYEYKIIECDQPGGTVRSLFVQNDHFFGRKGIYVTPDGEGFTDNNQRFFFYQLVILDLLKKGQLEVDILHCNDHHTGLLPALLTFSKLDIHSVFTIHNFLYHGHFDAKEAALLPPGFLKHLHKTQWGNYSALLEALDHTQWVNTVSPGYADELLKGIDLDVHSFAHILAAGDKFSGIVNGIDNEYWNPEKDIYLTHTYSLNDMGGKKACKAELLAKSGLSTDIDYPLFGSVSRLVENKGFPLIMDVIEEFVELGARFVFLGSGDPGIATQLQDLADSYPAQIAFHQGYNEPMAHLIEAGSDAFLMPSRFEPCGLNQLYSLRYGTVPIVNKTGGLSDTVTEYAENAGTGFLMNDYTPAELQNAMLRAMEVFKDKQSWGDLMRRGMEQDWSWDHSAVEYYKLYQALERGTQ